MTFEGVNVEDAQHGQEAERAGTGRFIYISSLGADTGQSEYHRSKRAAEKIVAAFHGGWIILRQAMSTDPATRWSLSC